jgi:N-methylhydantoinase A
VPFTPKLLADFHAEHKKRYGYSHPERDVELVTLRLRATIPSRLKSTGVGLKRKRGRAELQQVWFARRRLKTAVWERESLPASGVTGPAVITEYSATTVVPPGWSARMEKTGDLVLRSSAKTKRRPSRSA